MIRGFLTGVALVVFGIAGCPKPTPPPVTPPDAADAAPSAPPPCATVCEHVEADPPRGLACSTDGSCFEICQKVMRASWRACALAAPSCATVSACDQ